MGKTKQVTATTYPLDAGVSTLAVGGDDWAAVQSIAAWSRSLRDERTSTLV